MSELQIGQQVFDSWIIKEKIGDGSFGTVYKIERTEFGRIFESAMKVLSVPQSQSEIRSLRSDGMDDESVEEYYKSFVEDIISEIELMSKLKGITNIVSYEDHKVIEHNDRLGWDIFIRMEYLTPIFDYFQQRAIDIRTIIKLGIDICSALEICHKFNIVHRDIKPENIFISSIGDFKLGDFGIARTIEKTMGGLSKKGTYNYMAPEVYKGEAYGASVDIYSLGLVLYKLLNNNRLPFYPIDKKSVTYHEREAALAKRMSGAVIPPPLNGSDEVKSIILKACSYEPEKRYVSPVQFGKALEAAIKNDEDNVLIGLSDDDAKEIIKESSFERKLQVQVGHPHDKICSA